MELRSSVGGIVAVVMMFVFSVESLFGCGDGKVVSLSTMRFLRQEGGLRRRGVREVVESAEGVGVLLFWWNELGEGLEGSFRAGAGRVLFKGEALIVGPKGRSRGSTSSNRFINSQYLKVWPSNPQL